MDNPYFYIILRFRRLREVFVSHYQYVELAVIMNFIRSIQTKKDLCTFFIFGLSTIRPRDAVRQHRVWTYLTSSENQRRKHTNEESTLRWNKDGDSTERQPLIRWSQITHQLSPYGSFEDHMLDWHSYQICYPLEIKLLLLLLSWQRQIIRRESFDALSNN